MEELRAQTSEVEVPKPSKREVEAERLRVMRTRMRLAAARAMLEGRTYAGVVLSLAAATLPPHRLEAVLSRLPQDGQDGVAMAAFYLLGAKGLRGTWPGAYGWKFMERFMEGASASGQAELVLHLAHISTGAPLFLAATVAAAAAEWGYGEELLRLARVVHEKAAPLARSGHLRELLGPLPGEPKGDGQRPRKGNGSG